VRALIPRPLGREARDPWTTDEQRTGRPTDASSTALELAEDFVFSYELVRRRVVVACSEEPTLENYMGGYSNRHPCGSDDAFGMSENWLDPV
jgi:hypothetical protein